MSKRVVIARCGAWTGRTFPITSEKDRRTVGRRSKGELTRPEVIGAAPGTLGGGYVELHLTAEGRVLHHMK